MAKVFGCFLVATVLLAAVSGCLGGECKVDLEYDECLVNGCDATCGQYAPPGSVISAQCIKAQNHTDVYFCRCLIKCPPW